MNKITSYIAYAFVLLVSAGLFYVAAGNDRTALANGNDSPNECLLAVEVNNPSENDEVSYNTGNSQIVTGVCIKSGRETFGDLQHSSLLTSDGTYGNDSCYSVTGIGTSEVTVTRDDSSECKNISHLDVAVGNPTPTPTPTETQDTPTPTPTDAQDTPTPTDVQNTPSPTLTPTPTDVLCDPNEEYVNGRCIVIECDDEVDCEVVIGKTPTPTPTATTTPTPTPKDDDGGDDGDDDDNDDDGGNGGSSDGTSSSVGGVSTGPAVLGVSTMAPTGTFSNLFSQTLLISGLAFTALSGGMYARKK